MRISNAMLLRFASGVPYGFRDRQRFVELVSKIPTTKMCTQSSHQSDQSCFCTNTRTTHTRQNKPYRRIGAVRAGVVGARGRCWTAATVPVAVVLPCGVCCCIAENKQNTIINRKTELCHHRPQTKAHSNEYENNTHKAEQSVPAWLGAGGSNRSTRPLLDSSGLVPPLLLPAPRQAGKACSASCVLFSYSCKNSFDLTAESFACTFFTCYVIFGTSSNP